MKITTVPSLYSDPMDAVNHGIGLSGIPNSWMVEHPRLWTVVSHHEGALMADQPLLTWIAENGEPDNAAP